jgi:hypothetical protein
MFGWFKFGHFHCFENVPVKSKGMKLKLWGGVCSDSYQVLAPVCYCLTIDWIPLVQQMLEQWQIFLEWTGSKVKEPENIGYYDEYKNSESNA